MTDYYKREPVYQPDSDTICKIGMITLTDALDRYAVYGCISKEIAIQVKAYKEGDNDAILEFRSSYT